VTVTAVQTAVFEDHPEVPQVRVKEPDVSWYPLLQVCVQLCPYVPVDPQEPAPPLVGPLVAAQVIAVHEAVVAVH
jgi:hypothetical protein